MTAWTETAMAETYEDVRHLIYKVVHAFRRMHGDRLELAELEGEANLIFMACYAGWNRRIPFEKWIAWKTWKGLTSNARTIARHARARKDIPTDSMLRSWSIRDSDTETFGDTDNNTRTWLDALADRNRPSFRLDEFLECLSTDAQTVAMLALEPPFPIRVSADERWGVDNPYSLKHAIKEYLVDIGWSFCRIAESFSEIGDTIVS